MFYFKFTQHITTTTTNHSTSSFKLLSTRHADHNTKQQATRNILHQDPLTVSPGLPSDVTLRLHKEHRIKLNTLTLAGLAIPKISNATMSVDLAEGLSAIAGWYIDNFGPQQPDAELAHCFSEVMPLFLELKIHTNRTREYTQYLIPHCQTLLLPMQVRLNELVRKVLETDARLMEAANWYNCKQTKGARNGTRKSGIEKVSEGDALVTFAHFGEAMNRVMPSGRFA